KKVIGTKFGDRIERVLRLVIVTVLHSQELALSGGGFVDASNRVAQVPAICLCQRLQCTTSPHR
ncbi:hypothetical protein TGAM01_v202430, partial [Trichoderma gamsii]